MKSLFEVNGYNRFEKKKMIISVYGVRTSQVDPNKSEFLVFWDRWYWSSTENYTPISNKH